MINRNDNFAGKILGTCVLEKLIGQGGMGAVYLARQARPSRYVAVKVLLPFKTNAEVQQEYLARFRREADLIASLEHVNIMPIYEYGEQDGITYLVMPALPGGNLRDVLAKHGALPLRETLNYIEQAAAALDYAHAHGVIHRDIKPSNCLLHSDGRLVLADFGIARVIHDESSTIGATLTGTGMIVGTPEYMAPEMARGEPIDARADIYELGVVLFQMLSGQVPFKGTTPLVVVVKHLEEQLPSLHQLNPAIPAAVDRVVQKATAKRREDRYRSAGELAQALRLAITSADYSSDTVARNAPTVLSSQPIGLPPPTPAHETLPTVGAEEAMNFAAMSISERQRGQAPFTGPITPTPLSSPLTPYPVRGPTEQPLAALRPWLLAITALLVIAVAIGGVFVGLQLRGISSTPLPTATLAPVPSPTPTPIPTPTEIPTPTPTPPSSPAQIAQAVVQQYYDDINNRDYQAAYNLRQFSDQGNQGYNGFVNGYANTIHVDVTFGDITPLSDGTVQVWVTLNSLNSTSSGNVTITYRGYYIVGPDNGTWKILKGGHINQTS